MVKNLGLEYTEKKMEDFDSPQKMLEDIGKPVRTMPPVSYTHLTLPTKA